MITKDDSKNAIWLAYCDLRADYDQLSKERDQLKVEIEALKPYRDNHHDLMRHMAEHNARVIECALDKCPWYGDSVWIWIDDLRDYARKLRQNTGISQ